MPSVLITGAGRGIGRATALRLAAGGWEVLAGVRRAEDGEALASAGSGRITPLSLDITDEQQLEAARRSIPRAARMAAPVASRRQASAATVTSGRLTCPS